MEIMYVVHFPPSNLSDAKLEKLVVLNENPEGVELCLPHPKERPNNVSLPWVSF